MRETGGGSIVNISSPAGRMAVSTSLGYGATKAAVINMGRSVSQYCAEQNYNIRCNSILPGKLLTESWKLLSEARAKARGVTSQEIDDEVRAMSPLGDFIDVQSIAAGVVYLCSPEARFVTATELAIDGGMTGCDSFYMSKRFREALHEAG